MARMAAAGQQQSRMQHAAGSATIQMVTLPLWPCGGSGMTQMTTLRRRRGSGTTQTTMLLPRGGAGGTIQMTTPLRRGGSGMTQKMTHRRRGGGSGMTQTATLRLPGGRERQACRQRSNQARRASAALLQISANRASGPRQRPLTHLRPAGIFKPLAPQDTTDQSARALSLIRIVFSYHFVSALLPTFCRPGERPKTMTDGTIAGMVTGRQLQEELARKKEADRKRLAGLDSSVTGRFAKTARTWHQPMSLLLAEKLSS